MKDHICRLAKLARATGAHYFIATQRPSVDVITATIILHIGGRTVLNMNGAERLIGKGSLLYMPIYVAKFLCLQGLYISEMNIRPHYGPPLEWSGAESLAEAVTMTV